MTFDEWFNAKYPPHVYGTVDPEIEMMREEYRVVWNAAFSAAQALVVTRWNPNTDRMEPYNALDDQGMKKP